MQSTANRQLEEAHALTALWRALLPDHEPPSMTQFLRWVSMDSEATTTRAINRAATKAQREPMTVERIRRYVTGTIVRERSEHQHVAA